MAFRSIELHNFRSYPKRKFELHPTLTIVTGPNGIGKTNFLESLYVASTTKSWRAADRDLVSDGKNFWRLRAEVDKHQTELRYDLTNPARPIKKNQPR